MINPLKVATAGYLKRQTKAVLIIAVAGYLNFQGTPPSGGGGGGGTFAPSKNRYSWEEQEEDRRREREKEEEHFLIEFLKIATDIINNQ